jgi:xanthine/CO dehydrogenase XdhC/CoxF family maturation factor
MQGSVRGFVCGGLVAVDVAAAGVLRRDGKWRGVLTRGCQEYRPFAERMRDALAGGR